jgi:hypothetical protein
VFKEYIIYLCLINNIFLYKEPEQEKTPVFSQQTVVLFYLIEWALLDLVNLL